MACEAGPWRQTNLKYLDAIVKNLWKIAGLLVFVAGCGSSNEPVVLPLPAGPSEADLVNFAGDDILDPSAFDILDASDKRTDQVPGWDFVFQLGPDTVALRPRSEVTTDSVLSGLQQVPVSFEELTAAPSDGYITEEPVPIKVGDVLAGRSRRDPTFSVRCLRYGKFQVLAIDADAGTVTLLHLVNPNCEQTSLIPGEG